MTNAEIEKLQNNSDLEEKLKILRNLKICIAAFQAARTPITRHPHNYESMFSVRETCNKLKTGEAEEFNRGKIYLHKIRTNWIMQRQGSGMPLTEQTRKELTAIRGGIILPNEYAQFMVHWIAFNRAFNELRKDSEETARVLGIGDDLSGRWKEIIPQSRRLVQLECVGVDAVPYETLLRPNRAVKAATTYLRQKLMIKPGYPECITNPKFCRLSKTAMCQAVGIEPWNHSEMAAVMRIIYQIRCNLFHGEKRLAIPDVQTNKDQELIAISNEILNEVFAWMC